MVSGDPARRHAADGGCDPAGVRRHTVPGDDGDTNDAGEAAEREGDDTARGESSSSGVRVVIFKDMDR